MNLDQTIKNLDFQNTESLNIFFREFLNAKVKLLSEGLISGPDAMPYLFVSSLQEGTHNVQDLFQWCYKKGSGLVLNPERPEPDFIFTYGMVWNFIHNGEFLSSEHLGNLSNRLEKEKYFSGKVTNNVWPEVPRSWLKKFLFDQGIIAPKAVLLSEDGKRYEIAFSIESLGRPPEKEHSGILEAFSWFFPRHYSLILVSEGALPKAPFDFF